MRSKTLEKLLNRIPEETKIFVDWYADIVVRINQILEEKKITQKALAEKLDKTPSEISKWLSGEHNFTLRSLAKLSAELGEPLLQVPPKASVSVTTEDNTIYRTHVLVSSTKINTAPSTENWETVKAISTKLTLKNAG